LIALALLFRFYVGFPQLVSQFFGVSVELADSLIVVAVFLNLPVLDVFNELLPLYKLYLF
jgi:hypothetical protein